LHDPCQQRLLNMRHRYGITQSSVTSIKLKLSREARHGLPAVTTSIHLVSPPCYRNSSGILSKSDEPIAESLCCTASAMVWWLSRLQLTSNQLHPIPEGPKPDTDRSSATQTCTATPSFLLRSACGTLCQLTYASCHLPGSKLSWTLSS